MGRPRHQVTDEQRAEIMRLARTRGWGRARICAHLGLADRLVRQVMEESERKRQANAALAWRRFQAQQSHLREHAGEQSPKRLAREVSRLGPPRTEPAVRRQLVELGLAGAEPVDGMPRGRYTLGELRPDLTLEQVEDVTGIPRSRLLSRIERGELHARKEDGAWRVWPTKLREWLAGGPGRALLEEILGKAVEEPGTLIHFLLGELGLSEEGERRAKRSRREAAGGG